MKRIITICAALLMSASVFAQAPNKMSYQAVIRNSSNALVTNQSVGMRISILQGSSSGSSVYVETQAPTTNNNGLASIEIGGGTFISGNFTSIDWANGPYFIQTETDPSGGNNYTISGTSQLLSVPYALHANTADALSGELTEIDPVFSASEAINITSNDIANWNNDNVQDGDTTYWKVNNNNLYFNQGAIGIGTPTPMSNLHIFQNAADTNLLMIGAAGNYSSGIHLGELATENSNGRGTMLINEGGVLSSGFNGFKIVSGVASNSTGYASIIIPNFPASSNGFVGIGINPQQKFHVNDVMRLEPRNSAPLSPAKGDIYFDNTLNKLRVYDGTTWQNCW